MPFLEGIECHISSQIIFQGEFSGGCCKSWSMPFLEGGECYISSEIVFRGEFRGGCCKN
jgi:hypothetical protein